MGPGLEHKGAKRLLLSWPMGPGLEHKGAKRLLLSWPMGPGLEHRGAKQVVSLSLLFVVRLPFCCHLVFCQVAVAVLLVLCLSCHGWQGPKVGGLLPSGFMVCVIMMVAL